MDPADPGSGHTAVTEALPLAEGLACGAVGEKGGLVEARGADPLRRVALRAPDARCNDGSPAVMYVRPALTPAGAGRWWVLLQGGGACETPDACAERWCSARTPFGADLMSSVGAPAAIDGDGVLARGDELPRGVVNPWADANHVVVKSCSSDLWTGRAAEVALPAHDPLTGEPVSLAVSFLGASTLDAVFDALAAGSLDAGGGPMADLDGAEALVLSGSSAGGVGVVHAADRLRARLPQTAVWAFSDSALPPALADVGFEASAACAEHGVCTAAAALAAVAERRSTWWATEGDASCADVHRAEPWRCADDAHVALHHVATPLFVRMGLADGVLLEPYVDGGLTWRGRAFDADRFAVAVADQLRALAAGPPEEPRDGPPGVFAPSCPRHETLRHDPDTWRATVTPPGGSPVTGPGTFTRWVTGEEPSVVISHGPADSACPQ